MKKFFVIIAAALAFSLTASAQREFVPYVNLGVTTRVNGFFGSIAHPGGDLSVGFRNYNQDAFVSFAYGAEAFATVTPTNDKALFGAYAIPFIGVAIGPHGFKVFPHSGFMAGYNNELGRFNVGTKSGMAFDIGDHITLDLVNYQFIGENWIFNTTWISAVNFIWRF